jgi:signal transduction histidine kinase
MGRALPSAAGATARQIVLQAIRDAPPGLRRNMRLVLLAWVLMLAVQVYDVRDREGPRVIAEMATVVLGSIGIMLVGLMLVLREASNRRSTVPQGVGPGAADGVAGGSKALQQILLALPVVGFAGGTLLAAAVAVTFARVLLGTSAIVLVVGATYALFLVIAGRMVGDTTRLLYRHAEEQAAAAARAESHATEATLAALQAQMNPHFLFNALNTVASLVRTDPRAAESTVLSLSEVLRRTLQRSSDRLCTLGDEIEYVKAYLEVERERFADRLRVEWTIDPETPGFLIPPMILQPLVENAIRHGVGASRAGGRLRITAARAAERLRLVVEDEGDGFPPRYREGTGLGNLRRRLGALYGDRATLEIGSPVAGACVTVDMPIVREDVGARAHR